MLKEAPMSRPKLSVTRLFVLIFFVLAFSTTGMIRGQAQHAPYLLRNLNGRQIGFASFGGVIADNEAASDDQAIDSQRSSKQEIAYEFMWKSFDANYALFKAKHIDWKALYHTYRPLVSSKTTDNELFSIMSKTLGYLNDNHVSLILSTNPIKLFNTGFIYDYYGLSGLGTYLGLMQTRPVPSKYFKNPLKESENKIFVYGWLDDGIGYFHFNSFNDIEGSAKAIDEIIAEFKNAKAMIVDVRRNGGGDDHIGKLLAGRFADRKRLYMTTQERNGPNYDDFDPKKYFFVEPEGPIQFTKTVILLTNRLSISAADNFTLAMRILPQVTVVGDFTSGCFADIYGVNLPNGWTMTIARNLFLDYNGFCWEGIGVPPDLKIKDDYSGTAKDTDQILETAISLIKSEKLSLQDENEGLKSTRSLVELLEQEIDKYGIDKAIQAFFVRKEGAKKDDCYVSFFELTLLGRKMFQSNQVKKGEKIFSLASELFPGVSLVNDRLGLEYLSINRKKEAIQQFEHAISQKEKLVSPYSRQFGEYLMDKLIIKLLSGGYHEMASEYDLFRGKYPFQVNEELLNNMGYVFLGARLYDEAVHTFNLNIEKYPQSSNSYDSLADSYMRAGNRELAIKNYEKSLSLNPQNTNAIEQLKKLKGFFRHSCG
jgi:tetratricopeptide (TPR) repeat protein